MTVDERLALLYEECMAIEHALGEVAASDMNDCVTNLVRVVKRLICVQEQIAETAH
jgi:hypothetical protein